MTKKFNFESNTNPGSRSKSGIKRVEITVTLSPENNLSVVGSVANHLGKWESGGQCQDYIRQLFPNPPEQLQKILTLWDSWHLNDLKAGTPKQEEAVAQWVSQGHPYDYTKACEYLKSIGMYSVVASEANPYRKVQRDKDYLYGHEWLRFEIPEDVLAEIKNLLE